MAAGERLTLQVTGGGPWGFRLYGGDDDPLVVAKLRKNSKAYNGGLSEGDCILGINSYSCQGISHGAAMALVDGTNDLTLLILRGTSEKNAVDAAFQALGSQLRPVPASALPPGLSAPAPRLRASPLPDAPSPRPRASPIPPQPAAPAPARPQAQVWQPSQQQQQPQQRPMQQQLQNQVVNGFAEPSFSRERQTFQDGNTTTQVTTETSQEKVGGTTITKTKRETVSQSYGSGPGASMFKVSNVATNVPKPGQKAPGIWNPSATSLSAPPGVSVQHNPDQSITMTIGLDEPAAPAPQKPMFNVSKVGLEKPAGRGSWLPGAPPPRPTPSPQPREIPLLPEEEAEFESALEAFKKPFPVQLQKVLIESGVGSDHDSGPESPGLFSRRRMDSFDNDSDDDFSKKKMFADSAFYDDPEHKYPTIDEQVKMARKVALSLLAPANKKARGHRMFMRRMVKSQKWTTDDEQKELDLLQLQDEEEEGEEKYYNPNPWASAGHTWKPAEDVPPAPRGIPVAPPLPTNIFKLPGIPSPSIKKDDKSKALSADEFEKMRLFESKTDHTQVSPQMCFDLASDLRNMKGKGGKLFAKRVARSEKWDDDASSTDGARKPNPDLISKIAMQAAASGAINPLQPPPPMVGKPSGGNTGGTPVNRLKEMIDPPKPKMTPWDAAADHDGSVEHAFDHLKGYAPYGRSHQGKIADSLDFASHKTPSSNPSGNVAPVSSLPTSGQPSKMPDYTRKIKPWGSGAGSDSGSSASGASFSSPAAQPAAGFTSNNASSSSGFRSVGFRAGMGNFQPAASTTGAFGGAASALGPSAQEDVAFCDL